MKMKFSVIVATAFLALDNNAPATAAPLEQIHCIAENNGSEKMDVLGRALVQGVRSNMAGTSKGVALSETASYKASSDLCAEKFTWTWDEKINAQSYTIYRAGRDILRRNLEAAGVNFAAIDAFTQANLDRVLAAADLNSASDVADYNAIRDDMFALAGVGKDNKSVLFDVELYFAFTIFMIESEQGFIANAPLRGYLPQSPPPPPPHISPLP